MLFVNYTVAAPYCIHSKTTQGLDRERDRVVNLLLFIYCKSRGSLVFKN